MKSLNEIKNEISFWNNKYGKEISLRDIFFETKNIPMVIVGISGLKGKPTKVELSKLVPSQPTVVKSKIDELLTKPNKNLAKVLLYNGNYYIIDGHHRLSAEKLKGTKNIEVQLFKK